MSPDRAPLLTVGEAAERLAVTVWTVRRYIHNGELTAVKLARDFRVEPEALDAFVASRRSDRSA